MKTHRLLFATVAAVALSSAAFAQGSNKPPAKPVTASTAANTDMFKSLDKNGDGFIERSEATGGLAADFATLDTNKDGKLSNAEYAKEKGHK